MSLDLYGLEQQPTEPVAAESQFDVGEYLRRFRRRWKLLAAVAAACVVLALVQYSLTPAAYRAEAVIQIERRSLTPFSNTQNAWLDTVWNMEYYPTQYELLRSRGLAEAVVHNLRLADDPMFNPSAVVAGGTAQHATAGDDRAALGRLADRLRAGLSVDPVSSTQLVRLIYRSSDPELAARIANGFAETFIDQSLTSRSATVSSASGFLDQQIENLKREIRMLEGELQDYSRDQDIVAAEPESNVFYQRLESLNEDYIGTVGRRIERQARYEELASTPKEVVANAQSSGLVNSLKKELLELERRYDSQLETFKPDWPPLRELQSEIERDRANLDQVIEREAERALQAAYSEYQTLLRQEQKLAAEIDRAKQEAMDQNLAGVELANRQVEIKTRRDLLDQLLRRSSETTMALSMTQQGESRSSHIHMVEEALVPRHPYQPNLRRSLMLGLGFGLMLGFGAVLLVEFLDRSVKTPGELERLVGLPVLAVIPNVAESGDGYGYGYGYGAGRRVRASAKAPPRRWVEKKKGVARRVELAPHEQPKLMISEAYRSLRTALLLSTADELKAVAITSAESGEGKTVTIGNLAVVLAQLGRRVLLVDADLRKPRQHEVFGLSNRVGLVSHLTGTAGPEEIIQPTAVPNLFLAPSGPTPPNPSELLASERMRQFLDQAKQRFDFVLFDTPPVLSVTDATLIGSLVDGVVLCFRAGQVLREDARSCRDRLLRADVRLLGTVLNRHREPGGRYGRRYQGYAVYGGDSGDSGDASAHSAA